MSVVYSLFIFIAENFICHRNFLELSFGFWTRVFVRMKFQCKFSVSLFQFDI